VEELGQRLKRSPSGHGMETLLKPFGLKPEFCRHCGYSFGPITRPIQCGLCSLLFCHKCIIKLKDKEVFGLAENGKDFTSCSRCVVIINGTQKQTYYSGLFESANKDPLNVLFDTLCKLKQQISKMYMSFEYIATSLLDEDTKDERNEATFATVYQNAMQLQAELLEIFALFDTELKKLARVTASCPTQGRLIGNIRIGMTEFVSEVLPKFKLLRRNFNQIEMNTATSVYFIFYDLALSNRKNQPFWQKYGALFLEGINLIRADVQLSVNAAGESWEEHKSHMEQFLLQWDDKDPTKATSPLLRIKTSNSSQESEGPLLRKNFQILRKCLKKSRKKSRT